MTDKTMEMAEALLDALEDASIGCGGFYSKSGGAYLAEDSILKDRIKDAIGATLLTKRAAARKTKPAGSETMQLIKEILHAG